MEIGAANAENGVEVLKQIKNRTTMLAEPVVVIISQYM